MYCVVWYTYVDVCVVMNIVYVYVIEEKRNIGCLPSLATESMCVQKEQRKKERTI